MYEVTIQSNLGSTTAYIARAFRFSQNCLIMDTLQSLTSQEIITVFYPLMNMAFMESRTIQMAHEENIEDIGDEFEGDIGPDEITTN